MEQLPYIDEHSIRVDAPRERVWRALAPALRADFAGAAQTSGARLLGTSSTDTRGEWRATDTVHPGDTLPGFAVAEVAAPERLVLRGQHRFSRYALIFELDATAAETCTLRAQTWAEFPGLTGRAYRALVIGTRGHRLLVRRLLRNVARRAS